MTKQCCTNCQNFFNGYCAVYNEEIKKSDEDGFKCDDFKFNLKCHTFYNTPHKTPKLVGKKVKITNPSNGATFWGGFRQGMQGKYITFRIKGDSYILSMARGGIEPFYQQIDEKDIEEYMTNIKAIKGDNKNDKNW